MDTSSRKVRPKIPIWSDLSPTSQRQLAAAIAQALRSYPTARHAGDADVERLCRR